MFVKVRLADAGYWLSFGTLALQSFRSTINYDDLFKNDSRAGPKVCNACSAMLVRASGTSMHPFVKDSQLSPLANPDGE